MNYALLQGNEGSKKSNTQRDVCVEAVCGSAMGIVFATLFGIYTSDSSYHNGDQCVNLLTWGKVICYVSIIGSINSLILTPLFYCLMVNCVSMLSGILLIKKTISSLVGLAGLVGFIGLCVAYSDKEPCGQLEDLALGYIIFLSIVLGLAFIILCCVCCVAICMGGAMIAQATQPQNLNIVDQDQGPSQV